MVSLVKLDGISVDIINGLGKDLELLFDCVMYYRQCRSMTLQNRSLQWSIFVMMEKR